MWSRTLKVTDNSDIIMIISNNETVYIVSGFMRTGTSMMMKALEAGGIEVVARESREEMREKYKDEFYDPNEGGLYELEYKDMSTPDFPSQYKGKLIKVLNAGNAKMDVMPKLKIVYMRRSFEEIRQSYQAFFNRELKITEEFFYKNVEKNIRLLQNRKDVDLTILYYRDVIENPIKAFSLLEENGWPINPQKCAGEVNPELYRFREENLIKGIK